MSTVSDGTGGSSGANAPELQEIEKLHTKYQSMRTQLGGVLVGMDEIIEQVTIAILCKGHCILQGMPGLAKTLLVSSIAQLMHLTFRRIQFTPDLMPSDITGTDVLEEDKTTGKRVLRFVKGPLFGNLILADEINRTPPKTQSALLEAMQEQQLTIGGETFPLPDPFFVLATQNPIEQEGTYSLPEAQLDRFLFKIHVGYPKREDELEICKRATTEYQFQPEAVLSAEDLIAMQKLVRKVPVADHVYDFAVNLARLTRPEEKQLPESLAEMVQWGAGPRAGIFLLLAAKARAILHKRHHATTEDVAAVALPVLRHRIIPTFNAEAAGISTDQIVTQLLQKMRGGTAPQQARPRTVAR
ncbi:MAG: MoxR family ATPase [Planctomycetaceae bacterium]|nr:MoxR family ATPase [Planctomycetaceae bacterium]